MFNLRVVAGLVLAGTITLAACSDDKTGPSAADGESYIRADISGAYSGKFHATMEEKDESFDARRKYAGAFEVMEEGGRTLVVMGIEVDDESDDHSAGMILTIGIFNPEVGTYGPSDLCTDVNDDDCSVAATFIAASEDTEWEVILTQGTLKITELTADRISGTFELSGPAFTRSLALDGEDEEDDDEDWQPAGIVQVKNGRFSVDIDAPFGDLSFLDRSVDVKATAGPVLGRLSSAHPVIR